MAPTYKTSLIGRWVWIMLGAAAILLILIVLSQAATRTQRDIVVVGPDVQTGDPADFVQRPPTPTPTPEPAPAPGPTPEPTEPIQPTEPGAPVPAPPGPPPPVPPSEAPNGLPESFIFEGRSWQFAEGPVQVDVLTTGALTDGRVIYRRQNDNPPYDALYIETAPNSGQFYMYHPERAT